MWSAVVLICNLAVAPIFEMNEILTSKMLPNNSCYMSISPKWGKSERECLLSVGSVMKNPNFVVRPDFQIFSFECFQWDNHHYKGMPT
jgi:hypothetical protein